MFAFVQWVPGMTGELYDTPTPKGLADTQDPKVEYSLRLNT